MTKQFVRFFLQILCMVQLCNNDDAFSACILVCVCVCVCGVCLSLRRTARSEKQNIPQVK